MSRTNGIIKYWLPVVFWMGVIFVASGDALSGQRTSRFLGPLIHWLLPMLSQESVDAAVFYLRKTGHVTEYGVLALLLWRAIRKPAVKDLRPWSWGLFRMVLLLSALYAGTDELHQLFVPSREARVHDVALDTCGAAAALWFLWRLGRWRKHW